MHSDPIPIEAELHTPNSASNHPRVIDVGVTVIAWRVVKDEIVDVGDHDHLFRPALGAVSQHDHVVLNRIAILIILLDRLESDGLLTGVGVIVLIEFQLGQSSDNRHLDLRGVGERFQNFLRRRIIRHLADIIPNDQGEPGDRLAVGGRLELIGVLDGISGEVVQVTLGDIVLGDAECVHELGDVLILHQFIPQIPRYECRWLGDDLKFDLHGDRHGNGLITARQIHLLAFWLGSLDSHSVLARVEREFKRSQVIPFLNDGLVVHLPVKSADCDLDRLAGVGEVIGVFGYRVAAGVLDDHRQLPGRVIDEVDIGSSAVDGDKARVRIIAVRRCAGRIVRIGSHQTDIMPLLLGEEEIFPGEQRKAVIRVGGGERSRAGQ